MSQLMEYTDYLAKGIGPRPAGTQEEQQAALYITEQFQKDAGFTANIEEFQRSSRPDLAYAILAAITVVISLLAMFISALSIPAFVITALAAAAYVLEIMGNPLLSRLLARGASQNVVAKYQPNAEKEGSTRAITRKIILVAHYDSGRVTPPLVKTLDSGKLPYALLCAGGMVAAAFLMLLRIFVAISGGGALIILNVLTVVALIVCLLPVLRYVLMSRAPFNEGANNNASGTAALLEIARRISRGSVSEADLADYADEVVIHGAAAAQSAGLVPEGVEVNYEAAVTGAMDAAAAEENEEERLQAAKAAIAALTGKPVNRHSFVTPAAEEPTADEPAEESAETAGQAADSAFAAWQAQAAGEQETAAAPAEEAAAGSDDAVAGFTNVPSWFAAAQKNAKRSPLASTEVHRSRYTEAMENAERGRKEQQEARLAAEHELFEAEMLARQEEARAAFAAQEAVDLAADDVMVASGTAQADVAVVGGTVEDTSAAGDEQVEVTVLDAVPVTDGGIVDAESAEEVEILAQATEVPAFVDDAAAAAADAAAVSEVQIEAQAEVQVEATATTPEMSRAERLSALRTSIPSLSGVIRTKNAARSAAIKSVPDVLNVPTPAPDAAPADYAAAAAPAPASTPIIDFAAAAAAPADALPTMAPEPVSPEPVVKTDLPAARNADLYDQEVDYDMEFTASFGSDFAGDFATDFNPQLDTDFASNLVPDYAEDTADGGYGEYSSYSEYDEYADYAEDDYAPEPQGKPKKKSGGFFSRFRHKKQEEAMETPQEWLGVDEDFDARSVGRARGGWESFRNDDYDDLADPFNEDGYDTFGDFGADDDAGYSRRRRPWEGGAASRMSLGHVDMRSGQNAEADETIPDTPPEAENDRFITGEIEKIYHFRNPAFNAEVWFVAMGCDNDSHDGVKAFIAEHKSELRGSMVIEVESLAAGALSVAKREGSVKTVSASSRLKRYTRDAVAATGITLQEVDLSGQDSIASLIQKAGFQSMHLFGSEDGHIALKGSADDVVDNLDELVFNENVNFVYELLKR